MTLKLANEFNDDQLKDGGAFNTGYVCCCAWVQYGCPITLEGVKKLENTKVWNERDTDLYMDAVESIGIPKANWVEQLYQIPLDKLGGVYNLYLPNTPGIAFAVQRIRILPIFPPRKNLERCECYILDPLNGLFRIRTYGLSRLDEMIKQTIINLAANVLAPQDKSLCKDLCWADITKHANFTIEANSRGRNITKFQ